MGAAAAAGKLLFRKIVFLRSALSVSCETATGLLNVAPPSVDFTTHVLLSDARRVDPSQKTYSVPSGPTTGREPWPYRTFPEIAFGALNVVPPSVERTKKIGDWM